MRAGGINWLAVLAAAAAFYVLGFVIYGVIIPEEMMLAWSGLSREELEIGAQRMPFGALLPLATALFMAILFNWGNVAGATTGARWGMAVALASAIPTIWYGWVYELRPVEPGLVDSAHQLLGHAIAGAVLGRWR